MWQSIQPLTLLATAIGGVLGLIVGMIPGMTISTGIIVLLPVTFVLDPNISIALLLGMYVSGMTGGSFSAVLLNIPGTPSASATALDGYQLAKRGEAGRALGVAICASFAGGIISFASLYLIAPALADVAPRNSKHRICSVLVFFGLTIICSFASQSLVKGLLSAGLGLMIVTVGQDPVMGTARFTYGDANLLAGLHFLTALIGLFAIPQLVENLLMARVGDDGATGRSVGRVLPRLADLVRVKFASRYWRSCWYVLRDPAGSWWADCGLYQLRLCAEDIAGTW